MKKEKLLLVISLIISCSLIGQNYTAYQQSNALPKAPIRLADVMWMNTVWQKVDLHEKVNQGFYFPVRGGDQGRYSLFDFVKNELLSSDPSFYAYDPGVFGDNDMMNKRMSGSALDSLFYAVDQVSVERLTEPGVWDTIPVVEELSGLNVLSYEIKEQWYFDKQRSVMDVRIVGICPVLRVYNQETGEYRGEKRLFWLRYSELEVAMNGWMYFDPRNEMTQISYADMFLKRKFNALIVKTSNVYDRYIFEYAQGKNSLIEAEIAKMRLFNMEHDLWSY